jgi:hypothetical protein
MHFRHAIALLCLAVSNLAFAGAEPTDPEPHPIAVREVTDPWGTTDSPAFVLYADGQVIYRDDDADGAARYMTVRLDPERMQALTDKLRGFAPAVGHAEQISLLPGFSDQPETRFYLDVDGKPRVTAVYGLGVDWLGDSVPKPQGDVLPAEIAALDAFLSTVRYDDASEWVPARIEVFVWPYEYAPEASIQWPKRWPGLDAPTTVKGDEGYSLYLPGTELEAVLAFLGTRKERGAVEIGGRKWAASVQAIFPGAATWAKAFRQVRRTD